MVRSGPGDVETEAGGSVPGGRWGVWPWRAATRRSIHASCSRVKGGVSSVVGTVGDGWEVISLGSGSPVSPRNRS